MGSSVQLRIFLFILLAAFLGQSCTLEKRHYRAGYNIEWNSGRHSATAAPKATVATPTTALLSTDITPATVIPTPEKMFPNTIDIPSATAFDNRNRSKSERTLNRLQHLVTRLNKLEHSSKVHPAQINRVPQPSDSTKVFGGFNAPSKEAPFAEESYILGILALAALFATLFFPYAGLAALIASILAAVFGSTALASIKEDPTLTGKEKARFGRGVGRTILIVLLISAIIYLIALLAFMHMWASMW